MLNDPFSAQPDPPDQPARPFSDDAPAPALRLPVRRLDPEMPLPRHAKPGDAGMDLRASQDAVIEPGHRAMIGTGLAIAVPEGWVGLVHPRSGLAATHGITVLNAPGTIDSGYRGEVKVALLNTDQQEPFRIERGDRIAQLLLQRVARVELVELDRLEDSDRGETGFGSSGTR